MSVSFAGQWSGTFVSNGNNQFIALPAGADTCTVYNETVWAAGGGGTGARFFWRNGMPQGQGFVENKTAGTNALAAAQITAGLGFYWQNTTSTAPGAQVALTGVNNAFPPLVTTGNTAGLIPNTSIVRIYSVVGAQQLGGMDFTIGVVNPGVSFTLANMAPIVNAQPGAGTYSIIPYVPYFYPSTRDITAISPRAVDGLAIVTLSVTHTYQIGQEITTHVPAVTAAAFGMTALDGNTYIIVNTGDTDANGSTNTITLNINVAGMTPFAFPLTAAPGFTPASVTPVGMDTATALNNGYDILTDAEMNTGMTGLYLMGGATGPAGVATNVITWIAGKSWNQ
jgi:hypothetical protein